MNPTELAEIQDLERIADEAITRKQKLVLAELPMVPWTRQLQTLRPYDVPTCDGMEHWAKIEDKIYPELEVFFPKEVRKATHYALREAFKNTFEEAAKTSVTNVLVEYSDLRVAPIEFLFHSAIREISPVFAKYWKHQKDKLKIDGAPEMIDFYTFSTQVGNSAQWHEGTGLMNILCWSKECGFYRASDNTLITYLQFGKR